MGITILTKMPRTAAAVLLFLACMMIRASVHKSAAADQAPAEAHIADVIDGDTVVLSTGETVRYLGINAPEVRVRKGKKWIYRPQPLGNDATRFNQKLVEGKSVQLEYDRKQKDDYGRLLAYVKVGDLFINGELVRNGLALVDVRKPNYRYQDILLSLQQEARSQGRGLWTFFEECRVPAGEAAQHVDTLAMVQGRIDVVKMTRTSICLHFAQTGHRGFRGIIFRENTKLIPCEEKSLPDCLRDKEARLYGFIKDINGPAIVICAPTQIDLLE